MSDQLSIHTLGGLTIFRDGQRIAHFPQRKDPALLVYLACNPHPHPREVLAEMLWEGRSQAQSLANLRAVLTQLRQVVGDFLDITREMVAVKSTSALYVDAEDFERRLATRNRSDPRGLEQTIDLYQGDFLDGFYVDSQGFEDWALLERERLRFRAMDAFDGLMDSYLSQGAYISGIARATQLLHLDPLREKTYRQLMELLALSGEREAALTQYETCRRVLQAELGVAPVPQTTALFEHIRTGRFVPKHADPLCRVETEPVVEPLFYRPHHNLPVQSTSFIGREDELTTIIEQVNHPECRLLTLVGSGGIGKTRLALAVAERLLGTFADGVSVVSLDTIDSPQAVIPAIAASLQLQAHNLVEEQLLNFLRDKEMLLVLDNFEHLLGGTDIVHRILATAPRITVIATSREPLNLEWEWLFEVQGLRYPHHSQTIHAEDYDAVRLFVERTRRTCPTFHLSNELANVVHICRLVEGMPLGIELAAAWVRRLNCEEILAGLLNLEVSSKHKAERHRSLRALFDHTYTQLKPLEQRTLMRLAIFEGGGTFEAAEAVSDVPITVLASLIHKSLLHRHPETKRFTFHPLLQQYALERLEASGEASAASNAHAAYFIYFMGQQTADLKGGHQLEAINRIRSDYQNITRVWKHMLTTQRYGELDKIWWGFYFFHEVDNQHMQDGEYAFGQAEKMLTSRWQAGQLSPQDQLLLAKVLAVQGRFLFTRYQFEEARRRLNQSLDLLTSPEAYLHTAFTKKILGEIARWCGDLPQATIYLEESVQINRLSHDPWGLVSSLESLGWCQHLLKDHENAQSHLFEAQAIAQATHNQWGLAGVLERLASSSWQWYGNQEQSSHFLSQALEIRHQFGSTWSVILSLENQAWFAWKGGDLVKARRCYEDCYAAWKELGFPPRATLTMQFLGSVLCIMGEYQQAKMVFHTALRLLINAMRIPVLLGVLIGVAQLKEKLGDSESAIELLSTVQSHIQVLPDAAYENADLLTQLQTRVPGDVFEAAIAHGKDRDLLEVAREVLADLEQMP
jgi:predicted ATPase/DNA-binding SARP family transcriptional activator